MLCVSPDAVQHLGLRLIKEGLVFIIIICRTNHAYCTNDTFSSKAVSSSWIDGSEQAWCGSHSILAHSEDT